MRVEIGQIVTQIISFLVMFWVLKRYAWKPLLGLLDDRKNKIVSELDHIELQKKEISRLNDEYNEKIKDLDALARTKIQEAIKEGKEIASEIQQDAHAKAKSIISQAQIDLQGEVLKAKEQLRNEIVNMTILAAEKILSSKLSGKEDQKDLMADFINKM